MFRAKLLQPEFAAGPEPGGRRRDEAEIPWTQCLSGEFTLRKYFEDRNAGARSSFRRVGPPAEIMSRLWQNNCALIDQHQQSIEG
jgi:hypothetical protein